MLKTLLLTHEYYPFSGGVARYCYNLFKFLPKDKYLEVCDNPVVKSKDNIIHLKLQYKFIKPSWLFSLFQLSRIIRQEKVEQIFTPNILPLGSIAYLFFKFLKIPYVISLHGLDINNALKNKPRITKLILKSAKAIVCNTKYTASRLAGLGLEEKTVVIYPSLTNLPEPGQSDVDLKGQYHIQSDEKVLLTVARLTHRKGHDLVLKSLANLRNLKFKYLIVGLGPEMDNLKKLVQEKKLEDRVVFCGEVADSMLVSFYKLADIFVMPHRQLANDVEGLGMVFLEAASFSLPIIAGISGGVSEIFTDQRNIIFIKNDSVAELELALTSLLNNDKLALNLGQEASLVVKNFPSASEQSQELTKILS